MTTVYRDSVKFSWLALYAAICIALELGRAYLGRSALFAFDTATLIFAAYTFATLSGASSVSLDASGFTVVAYWVPKRYSWDAVTPFATQVEQAGRSTVRYAVFDTIPPARGFLTGMRRSWYGYGLTLPTTIGIGPTLLAMCMNSARTAALRRTSA